MVNPTNEQDMYVYKRRIVHVGLIRTKHSYFVRFLPNQTQKSKPNN